MPKSRSSTKVQRILESLPHAVLLQNREGHIIYANHLAEILFGYKRSELQNRSIAMLIAPYGRDTRHAKQKLTEAFKLHNTFALHKNGRKISVDIDFSPVQNPDALQILAIFSDATERDKAEMKLRQSEERFRVTADAAPVMIWQSDVEKRCCYFNKQWLEFTGRTLEKELGEGWIDGVHPDDRAECLNVYVRAFDNRRPFSMEYRLRRFDGEYRWILDNGEALLDTEGKFSGYVGSCIDITEHKAVRMEAEVSRDALLHSRRVAALGELSVSLAHELNQPLSAILSNAQAALRFLEIKPDDLDPVKDILKDIVVDDKRAGDVIRKLRALLKTKKPEREAIQINDLIQEVVSLFHSDALSRQTRLSTLLADKLQTVFADSIQLQQVLFNLIANGLEAMENNPPETKILTIRTFMADAFTAQISIIDTGPGLPEGDGSQVFKPFYTTKKEGLGMGLSIARTIVEAHKGRLWAENSLQGGAMFHLSLPASHE